MINSTRSHWLIILLLVIFVGAGAVFASPSLRSYILSVVQPTTQPPEPQLTTSSSSPAKSLPVPIIVDDSKATPAGTATVVGANNQSGIDLYAQLRTNTGNVFFSPLSISEALAMVYEGARGKTAQEIQPVFHLPTDDTVRRSSFAALYNELNAATSTYQLSIANALWVQKDYSFLSDYTNTIKRYYGGEANTVDFVQDISNALNTINTWVSGKTNGKIPQLFSPGSLDSSTRLVLTDAVYFKGKWMTPFEKTATQDVDFHVNGTQTTKVSMMQNTDDFAYTETNALQALEMPYEGGTLSMLVLLPKNNDLSSLEKSLTLKQINALRQSLQRQKTEVFMPKFTFSTSYTLNKTLASMGMPTAFDSSNADFSGMDGRKDLFIGLVIHKAYVAVDEEGTEAAAATGVSMALTSMPQQNTIFRADHPFIFLIQDTKNGSILFFGRVSNPAQQ